MYFLGVLRHFEEIPRFMPLPIMGYIGGHVGGHKIDTKIMKLFFPLTILARYEAKIAKICNFWTFKLVIQLL